MGVYWLPFFETRVAAAKSDQNKFQITDKDPKLNVAQKSLEKFSNSNTYN